VVAFSGRAFSAYRLRRTVPNFCIKAGIFSRLSVRFWTFSGRDVPLGGSAVPGPLDDASLSGRSGDVAMSDWLGGGADVSDWLGGADMSDWLGGGADMSDWLGDADMSDWLGGGADMSDWLGGGADMFDWLESGDMSDW
jgi:hypothetical protein